MSALHNARTSLPLTNMSLAYMNKLEDFLWFKVAPAVTVKAKSGSIYEYGKDALRITDTAKATNGRYNKINLSVSKSDHYYLESYGLFADVLEQDVENAEAPINAEMDTAQMLLQKVMLDGEKKLADSIFSGSVITQNTTLTTTAQWSDYTTGVSNPITNINTGINTIRSATGKLANTLVFGYRAWETFKFHPKILAMFPGAPEITKDMLESAAKRIFGIKNVYVGAAVHTDTNLGAATETMSDLWTDSCLVAYIEETPTLKSRTLCVTYVRKAKVQTVVVGKSAIGERAELEEVYSIIGQKIEYDQVIVDAACGYLIIDVNA